jgi:hypothetical protein
VTAATFDSGPHCRWVLILQCLFELLGTNQALERVSASRARCRYATSGSAWSLRGSSAELEVGDLWGLIDQLYSDMTLKIRLVIFRNSQSATHIHWQDHRIVAILCESHITRLVRDAQQTRKSRSAKKIIAPR